MRYRAFALVLALVLLPIGRAGAQRTFTRDDSVRAVHLLERATYGARTADVQRVLEMGSEAWLEAQLHPERVEDSGLAARMAALPAAAMTPEQLYQRFPPPNAVKREIRAKMEQSDAPEAMKARPPKDSGPQRMMGEIISAKLNRAAFSERQLEEVMTDFWFNHFNVFAMKKPIGWLLTDYERTAIRPHVFGRFSEMLKATAAHPAMLVYLDNARSVAADSSASRRRDSLVERWKSLSPAQREAMVARGRITPEQVKRLEQAMSAVPKREMRGLNENYARELLELHTLGVDGGYTQHDVREVARILTGWTVAQEGRSRGMAGAGFTFRAAQHDSGPKQALGLTFPAGGGQEEGTRLLEHLAAHPSTARHLATKLVEFFVSDRPDPVLVDRLAQVYLDTGGDLRTVTRVLFTSDAFYAPEHRASKLKPPFRLVAGALRLTATEVGLAPGIMQTLRELAHVPYLEDAPTGYPATSMEWTNSGAMLTRMNFGLGLASGRIRGVSLDPALTRTESLETLAARLLPARETGALVATVQEDLRAQPESNRRALRSRGLGLLLGSPEFQKH